MAPSKKDFPIALRLEVEAKNLEKQLGDPALCGVKCWYCDAQVINQGSVRVLMGINPGGNKEDHARELSLDYFDRPYKERGFNAWLDEDWTSAGKRHQQAVQDVFKTMHNPNCEKRHVLT